MFYFVKGFLKSFLKIIVYLRIVSQNNTLKELLWSKSGSNEVLRLSRRGDNIRKRKDGRYEGRYIDRYDEQGKACYKSVYGSSYTEAKNKLLTSIQFNMSANIVSTEALCNEYLESIVTRVKQSTYAIYYRQVQEHIIPYFKNINVDRINNDIVNRFINDKSIKGRLDKKGGLSPKTVTDILSLLNQILSFARNKGYFAGTFNIAKPKSQTKTYNILSFEEQKTLAKYLQINTTPAKLGVLISLYTGIRLGELCALKWSDIDIPNGTLKIDKTIQRIKNTDKYSKTKTRIIIDKPKSQKSIRVIPLPSFLLKELSVNKSNDSYYILTGNNKYVEPRTYQTIFKKMLKEAGLNDINFHTLRHTFATRAIEQGFDVKALSEILGHSSVKFTLDSYVHPSQELKKLSMEKLACCY